jgi:hypothetical protein
MKMMFKVLAITAVAGLSFGSAEANPNCKKINVPKKADAKISVSFGCASQLASIPEFSSALGGSLQFLAIPVESTIANVCYVSVGPIPGKIGGKPVTFETVSALLANGNGDFQPAITLYSVSGAYTGDIYAVDTIHSLKGYEDEVFIGGSGDFAKAGGTGRLTFPAFADNASLPPSIGFTRVKGDICFGTAQKP